MMKCDKCEKYFFEDELIFTRDTFFGDIFDMYLCEECYEEHRANDISD